MRQFIIYIFYIFLYFLNNVSGAYFPTSQSIDSNEAPIRVHHRLPRRSLGSRLLYARSPLPQQRDKSTSSKISTTTKNVEHVNSKGAIPNDNIAQEAAKSLFIATQNVDDLVMILQNTKSSEIVIKKAAQDAIKNEADSDFPRQVLASAATNASEAQSALAIVRDQKPVVVGGFEEIEKNSGDKNKVIEILKDVLLARLQLVGANMALVGGIKGSDRKLISNTISPSQEAINEQNLDIKQKKRIEESKKNLLNQTNKVNELLEIIQKSSSSPQQIKIAAKEALVQEAGEDFARQVLASAARDPKAAMEALANVKDHGPNEVIAGFKAISENPQDTNLVKKNIDLITKGREFIVPANMKLIELAGGLTTGTTNSKELQQAKNEVNNNNNTKNQSLTNNTKLNDTSNTNKNNNQDNNNNNNIEENKKKDQKNLLTKDSSSNEKNEKKINTNINIVNDSNDSRDPRGLLASLAGDDNQEPSVVLFGSAGKPKNKSSTTTTTTT